MAKAEMHPAAIDDVTKQIHAEVEKIAQAILSDSQQIVPVETGLLKASGFVESDGKGHWQIGYDRKYADEVEVRTPFLTPAALKKRGS